MVRQVYKKRGIELPKEPNEKGFLRVTPPPDPWDVVVIANEPGMPAGHVGIVVDGRRVLHVDRKRGVAVAPFRAFESSGLLIGIYRYAGG